jgi:hypothetical protein
VIDLINKLTKARQITKNTRKKLLNQIETNKPQQQQSQKEVLTEKQTEKQTENLQDTNVEDEIIDEKIRDKITNSEIDAILENQKLLIEFQKKIKK